MLQKKNLTAAGWPALTLWLVTIAVAFLIDPISGSFSSFVSWAVSWTVTCALFELFAYLTCWALVFRRGKGARAVWINYIVWILIANIGPLNDFLS